MDYLNKSNWSRNVGLRYLIGLGASLSLILTAFEWKSFESETVTMLTCGLPTPDQMIEIPDNQPLPPPVLIQPEIIETFDEETAEEILLDLTSEFAPDDACLTNVIDTSSIDKNEEFVCCFCTPQIYAEPEGGMEEFYKYLQENLKYPSNSCIEGKVYVAFYIEIDGSITNVKTVKGIDKEFDKEAERVIAKSPKWKPAKEGNCTIRQKMIFPIKFKIS